MSKPDYFRRPHKLARNEVTRVPSNLLFFDTESYPIPEDKKASEVSLSLMCGVAKAIKLRWGEWAKEKLICFYQPQDFWDFLYSQVKPKQTLYVFAHNIAFDLALVCLHDQIASSRIKVNFACLESPPFILNVNCERGKIIFLDTYNYWQVPLREIGECVGLPKLRMPGAGDDIKDWINYCARDVDIVVWAMLKFIQTIYRNDLGIFRHTMAAQSMSSFRHRFMLDDIVIHGDKQAVKLEREAYYGGRCSFWFYGKTAEKVYCVDVNSMYPYVMMMNRYPRKLVEHFTSPSVSEVESKYLAYSHVARVKLNAHTSEYPERRHGKIVYRKGEFITTLCGLEFLRAMRQGEVVSIGEIAIYEADFIFDAYMTYLLNQRAKAKSESDKQLECMWKSLANGLYGKFGQRGMRWEAVEGIFPPDGISQWPEVNADTEEWMECRFLGGRVERKITTEESAHSFPAIAACVTSAARVHMDELRKVAGDRNVFLQYIDSLVCTERGFSNLAENGWVSQDGVGKLKILGQFDGLEIHSAQDYSIGGKHKIVGIPQRAIEYEQGVFTYDHFETPQEIFARQGDGTVKVTRRRRKVAREQPEGRVGIDGWVSPLE